MRPHDPECVFCRIVRGELPATKHYEDDEILVFDDLVAQAPVHFLVIPKVHIATADDIRDEESPLVGRMLTVARSVAREKGLVHPGYRIAMNINEAAGQLVFHIHFHVLGGRPLGPIG